MARWGRSRERYGGYGGYGPYVPVAERRANAVKAASKLRGKGVALAPVEGVGRSIATTFWGKGWCTSIERHADWANRLERGRTYARNGAIVDLRLGPGSVDAIVAGTSTYQVHVDIVPLAPAQWQRLAADCAGRVASLLELLQGRLDKVTLERLCHPSDGLFPLPRQMTFRCSCPDGAMLCKHVAATLYGVGHRLDSAPELLFQLRQVDAAALLAHVADASAGLDAGAGALGDDDDLAAIFGVDLDVGPAAVVAEVKAPAAAKAKAAPPAAAKRKAAGKGAATLTAAERQLLAAFAERPDDELQLEAVRMLTLALPVAAIDAAVAGLARRGLVAEALDDDGTAWWGVTAAGVAAAAGAGV